jgi:hypothetical protein
MMTWMDILHRRLLGQGMEIMSGALFSSNQITEIQFIVDVESLKKDLAHCMESMGT